MGKICRVSRLRVIILTIVASVVIVFVPSAASLSRQAALGPPDGLTAQGRLLWNMEALLRDTFERRTVWLHYGRTYDFSTASGALCCAGQYYFTFSNARGSRFRAIRPTRPPKTLMGASGGEVPLTIRLYYISCGSGRWLFRRVGNGPANWKLSCRKG